MGCCGSSLDPQKCLAQLTPEVLIKIHGNSKVQYSGSIIVLLQEEGIEYDGCPCCTSCCIGIIEPHQIVSIDYLGSFSNDKYKCTDAIHLKSSNGTNIYMGPLTKHEFTQVCDVFQKINKDLEIKSRPN